MPSKNERPKARSKEDTWGASELASTIQDATADRERRSKDRGTNRDKATDERRQRVRDNTDDEKHSREKRERSSREKTGAAIKERGVQGGKEKNRREKDERHKNKEKQRVSDDNRDKRKREIDGKRRDRQRDKESDKHRDDGDEHRDGERRDKGRMGSKDRDGASVHEKDSERHKRKEGHEKESDRHRRRDGHEKDSDRHRRREGHERDRERHRSKDGHERDAERHRGEDKDRNREGDKIKHRDDGDERRRRKKEKLEKEDEVGRERRSHPMEENKNIDKGRTRHEENDKDKRRHEEDKRRRDERENGRDRGKGTDLHEEERRKRKEEKKNVDGLNVRDNRVENEEEVPDEVPEADGNNYEDDFEDYEDDFEDEEDTDSKTETDIDDSTLAELRQAMEAENKASSQSGPDSYSRGESSTGSTRPTTSTRRPVINFVAAKQRQISNTIAARTRERGQVLMKMIELDTVSFNLFDMHPVKDYERFIQHFGRSDTTQAIVQCNDDNLEREVQTEEIETRQKWCQHPAEGVRCSGGDGDSLEDDVDFSVNQEAHSLRLTQFLEAAGQLMAVLLEESRAEEDGGKLKNNQRSIVFSEGYTQLKPEITFLKGRSVLQVQIHPVQTHLVLATYGESKLASDDHLLSQRGILCIWNINDPSQPQKILSCRSQPRCCSWSPTKATMAFAGTVDGSLLVWDLREPSGMHRYHLADGGSWLIRVPTFSTDGILIDEAHDSGVVALLPVVTVEDSLRASMPQEQHGGSDITFQLASLEERGVINFWVVLEIAKTSQAGSESELGLVPGGRVKLIWSSTIDLNSPNRDLSLTNSFKAFCIQLNPQDPSQFYVGTDGGFVLHVSRHHESIYPKVYRANFEVPVEVTNLDFSPFGLSCFLVACSDGSIRLHSTMCELPLLSWPNSSMGMEITAVVWSQSRPSVFYTADSSSKVFVWSLLEKDGNPVKTEQFSNERLTALCASNDYSASSLGRPGRRPELVIADSNGCLEVHRLNERFSNASGDELDSMAALLESYI